MSSSSFERYKNIANCFGYTMGSIFITVYAWFKVEKWQIIIIAPMKFWNKAHHLKLKIIDPQSF